MSVAEKKKLMSGSFLKFSCSVESDIIIKPLSYFPL